MAPIQPVDSSIETSSETWATLVANIAPLLVLVGEKHVKEYFKIMSRPSHYILFAAGPIGLVTTVTTLIRIKGAPILKKLIGRSSEKQVDMLADVTGISTGAIRYQLTEEGGVEQSSEWDDGSLARFSWQGGINGGVKEVGDYWKRAQNPLDPASEIERLVFNGLEYLALGGCVRARGEAGAKTLMRNIQNSLSVPNACGYKNRDIWGELFKAGDGDMDAATYCIGGIDGVSPNHTFNYWNLDGGKSDGYRLLSAILCLSASFALIVVNWFQQTYKTQLL